MAFALCSILQLVAFPIIYLLNEMHMKKHLLTLCCALAIVLLMPSCGNDDKAEGPKGDVEFTDVALPQVKATIKGFWRFEKRTEGIPGSSSEIEIDGNAYHNLGFKGDQVMYVNTDPAALTMPPTWETMTWGTSETSLGNLPFYTSADPLANSISIYLVGIREDRLVTAVFDSGQSKIYYSYYSRLDSK